METGSSSGSITIHNASIFITCLGRWMTDCSRDITLVKRNGHDEIVPSVTHNICSDIPYKHVQKDKSTTASKRNRKKNEQTKIHQQSDQTLGALIRRNVAHGHLL